MFVDPSPWETYIRTALALGDNNVNLRRSIVHRLSAGSFCLDDIRKIEISDDIES